MHKEQVQGQGEKAPALQAMFDEKLWAPNVSGSTILLAQHKISLAKYSVL